MTRGDQSERSDVDRTRLVDELRMACNHPRAYLNLVHPDSATEQGQAVLHRHGHMHASWLSV